MQLTLRQEILTQQGYRTLITNDCEECLMRLEGAKVDLVILDFDMKPMNGYQMAKAIRKMNPKMPIIILTSYESGELPDDIYFYISKRITKGEYSELFAAVERFLRKDKD